ncbi:hypothetical protein D0Z70_07485 [Sphingobium terrigena]|uniref:Uncharacterized protein n=1 Tax=Sphingobium terrigena TaxID=2304063 RepID=A0A418YUP7_9SPHN|nr:DUF6118 family protein [Sphingobium terrigena]RJG55870.1 hypothetical protein D0Z70_07485 [Sphingobium terrigena]
MDEHSLLREPDPEPQAGTAAEAFARLAARVEAMEGRLEGRMAVIARALEHIAVEKQSIEVPDYNPTLGKINASIADLAKRMKAVEQSEALRITPESMAERIAAAAEAARETDKASIKDARELQRQAVAAMTRTTGTLRAKEEQRRHLLCAIGSAMLATSLLWLVYPGWAASMAPQSWHWPERVARRAIGEPTLWDAGIRLMQAGNQEGWQAIVAAADMRQANRDTIATCERAAAKARKPVRCTIEVERRES